LLAPWGPPISRARQPSLVRKPFMAKLDGKITLISGGTSGIGAETAKLFQSEGATVVVTGSSERSVEAAKAMLPGIEVLVSDASNVAATKVLVDLVKTKHGRIDVLFVNARSPDVIRPALRSEAIVSLPSLRRRRSAELRMGGGSAPRFKEAARLTRTS
jgi:NAD(P)-dependent dehydrogenase (short-subunit alcohol dehydrogenase family)